MCIKRIMKKLLYIIGFVLAALSVNGQFVTIKDTAFANAIAEKYPNIVSADGTQLDTVQAATKGGFFSVKDRGTVTDVEELKYFKSLTNFNALGNKITKIPDISATTITIINFNTNPLIDVSNLAKATQLENLNLGNTGLSVFTEVESLINLNSLILSGNNLTSLPDLSALTKMVKLSLNKNALDEIVGTESMPLLADLALWDNNLTSLPDFSVNPNLSTVTLHSNFLSWEDLMPLTNYPDFANVFTPFPQDELTPDAVVNLKEGETFTISYDLDQSVSGLTYRLVKNDVEEIASGTSNVFTISNVQKSDANRYEIFAMSSVPEWNGQTVTGETRLNVADCFVINDYTFSVNENCPNVEVSLVDVVTDDGAGVYDYYLVNQLTADEILFAEGEKKNVPDGFYNLKVVDANSCTKTSDNALVVNTSQECTFCDSLASITITDTAINLVEYDELQLELKEFEPHSQLSFQWMKDGENIAGETVSPFNINGVAIADAGIYTASISCALADGSTYYFQSRNFDVSVGDCQKINDYAIEVVEQCPNIRLRLSSIDVLYPDKVTDILAINAETNEEFSLTVGSSVQVSEGIYALKVVNDQNCSRSIDAVAVANISDACVRCDSLSKIVLADSVIMTKEFEAVEIKMHEYIEEPLLVFQWFADNALILNTNDILSFATPTKEDAAVYHAEVTCNLPDGSSIEFTSRSMELQVTDCQTIGIFSIKQNETCPETEVLLESIDLLDNSPAFSIYAERIDGNRTALEMGTPLVLAGGVYNVLVTDNASCERSINSAFTVAQTDECKFCDNLANLSLEDVEVTAKEFESIVLKSNHIGAEDVLKYTWFKDGELLTSQTDAQINLTNIKPEDAGVYQAKVGCSVPSGSVVEFDTETINLSVGECQIIQSFDYALVDKCPDVAVSINELTLLDNSTLFTVYLVAEDGTQNPVALQEEKILGEGQYDLFITDANLCHRTIENAVDIVKSDACLYCESISSTVLADTALSVFEGDGLSLKLPITDNGQLEYKWSFAGNEISDKTNPLIIDKVKKENEGVYKAHITCVSNSQTLSVNERSFTVSVLPYQTVEDYTLSVREKCNHSVITLDDLVLSNPNAIQDIYLENVETKIQTTVSVGTSVNVDHGSYNLVLTNPDFFTETITDIAVTKQPEDCRFCDSVSSITLLDYSAEFFEHQDVSLLLEGFTDDPRLEYFWYYNGDRIENSNSREYTINDIETDDAGMYTIKAVCRTPALQTAIFSIKSYSIIIKPYQEIGEIKYSTINECNKTSLLVESIELSNTNADFKIYALNTHTEENFELEIGEPLDLFPGIYHISVTDHYYFEEKIDEEIILAYPEHCDNIFSPNGDGYQDTWFVETDVPITIVDKSGKAIKTSDVSFYWDGKDDAGNDVQVGVYSIVFPNKEFIKVTLVR